MKRKQNFNKNVNILNFNKKIKLMKNDKSTFKITEKNFVAFCNSKILEDKEFKDFLGKKNNSLELMLTGQMKKFLIDSFNKKKSIDYFSKVLKILQTLNIKELKTNIDFTYKEISDLVKENLNIKKLDISAVEFVLLNQDGLFKDNIFIHFMNISESILGSLLAKNSKNTQDEVYKIFVDYISNPGKSSLRAKEIYNHSYKTSHKELVRKIYDLLDKKTTFVDKERLINTKVEEISKISTAILSLPKIIYSDFLSSYIKNTKNILEDFTDNEKNTKDLKIFKSQVKLYSYLKGILEEMKKNQNSKSLSPLKLKKLKDFFKKFDDNIIKIIDSEQKKLSKDLSQENVFINNMKIHFVNKTKCNNFKKIYSLVVDKFLELNDDFIIPALVTAFTGSDKLDLITKFQTNDESVIALKGLNGSIFGKVDSIDTKKICYDNLNAQNFLEVKRDDIEIKFGEKCTKFFRGGQSYLNNKYNLFINHFTKKYDVKQACKANIIFKFEAVDIEGLIPKDDLLVLIGDVESGDLLT